MEFVIDLHERLTKMPVRNALIAFVLLFVVMLLRDVAILGHSISFSLAILADQLFVLVVILVIQLALLEFLAIHNKELQPNHVNFTVDLIVFYFVALFLYNIFTTIMIFTAPLNPVVDWILWFLIALSFFLFVLLNMLQIERQTQADKMQALSFLFIVALLLLALNSPFITPLRQAIQLVFV